MGKPVPIEPFLIQEIYASDAEFEISDNNLFVTYLRRCGGERIVVGRVIIPMVQVSVLLAKVRAFLTDDGSTIVENVIKLMG